MEEIYLSAKEVAELKGCSERYIQNQVQKGNIRAEQISGQATGRGGIQYRIPLSGLERKLQTKFKRRLRAVENASQPEPV
ncbi:MAG: helix-turn-helix domain-containing protein, partial [Anaerotignum sp.]|nr:helix-turn-helix domain-containing protein [Anaerotignum sp.]